MIDTHCHLTDERLLTQLDDVLARAAAAGVGRMITIGTDLEDDRACIDLCRGRENVRCAIGLHPNYVGEADLSQLPRLIELQQDPSVLALGEMGLDYHYTYSGRTKQVLAFEAQLQMAVDLQRPVVIHCREATHDCLAIMKKFPDVRAVFHCFTGTPAEARQILDAGYLLGFTGAITFKKADDLREAVRQAPLDRMLVETDAPYLSPEPLRKQKTNEPAFVIHTAAVVARMKSVTVEEIDQITTANASEFFGWR